MTTSTKTSAMFHGFIDMRRQLKEYQLLFTKPFCKCLTTMPKHVSFWAACAQVLDNMDELVSLALQMLCDTQHCPCLETPVIIAGLDTICNIFQSLCYVLNMHKGHKQQGTTWSMLEDAQLMYTFDILAKRAHRCTHKLVQQLQQCSNGHDSLVLKYTACPMEE
jgi:hypothetical protein